MLTLRFFRSDAVMERLPADAPDEYVVGPLEWAQITYNELRVGEYGEVIAFFDHGQDGWIFLDPQAPKGLWSDVVIFTAA